MTFQPLTHVVHSGQPCVVTKVYLRTYRGVLHAWVEMQSVKTRRIYKLRQDVLLRNLFSGRTKYAG